MPGEPLTPEEMAQFEATIAARGGPPPGAVTYDNEEISKVGPGGAVQLIGPTPPPRTMQSFAREAVPEIPPDAFAASRGAAQQERASALEKAAAPPPPDPHEALINAYPGMRNPEVDGPPPAPPGAPPAAGAPPPEMAPAVGGVSMPRPVVIPGGWQPHSRSGRLDVPDEVKQQAGQSLDMSEQAVEAGAQAASQGYESEGQVLDRNARWLESADAAIARRESARADQMERAQMRLEDLTDKAAKASEISSDRYWANKGAGAKMVGILGVALSGFAAGMRGGTNQALDIIQRDMDRDLEAQKAQAANVRGQLADQRGLLGSMKENFADSRQAETAAKIAYWKRAEIELSSLAKGTQSKETQARATELLAGIQARRADLGLKFTQLEQGNLHEVYRPAQVVGGPPKANPEQNKLFVPTGPNGQGYFAKTEEEAKKGRALRTAVASMENIVNEAKSTRAKTSFVERAAGRYTPIETEDYSKLASLGGQAIVNLKNAEDMGALDKGVVDTGGPIVGEFTRPGGNPTAAADVYVANLRKKMAEFERSQAGQGAQQTIALDSQGRPVAVALGQASMASPRAQMPAGFKPLMGPAPEYVPSPQKDTPPSLVLPTTASKKKRGDK